MSSNNQIQEQQPVPEISSNYEASEAEMRGPPNSPRSSQAAVRPAIMSIEEQIQSGAREIHTGDANHFNQAELTHQQFFGHVHNILKTFDSKTLDAPKALPKTHHDA